MEGKIHIYCINLKHRGDRWSRFSKQPELAKLMNHYTFERFEAINGTTLDINSDNRLSLRTQRNIKEHIRRDHEELDSAGGVGCYLSHTGVWKSFMERPEPYAIIFEDDAIIPPGFTDNLHQAMKDATLLPRIPDLISFSETHGAYFDAKGRPLPNTVKTNLYGPWVINVCTTFTGYLITKRGAERLLEKAFPIDMHVDMYACMSSDLDRILTAQHRNLSTPAVALRHHDTDIAVKEECPICNVPTHYREKGIVMVNLPITLICLGVIGSMWYWMSPAAGGRRR